MVSGFVVVLAVLICCSPGAAQEAPTFEEHPPEYEVFWQMSLARYAAEDRLYEALSPETRGAYQAAEAAAFFR